MLDLATHTFTGIKNTSTFFGPQLIAVGKIRYPRPIPSDNILVPYSEREAQGTIFFNLILQETESVEFTSEEEYLTHVFFTHSRQHELKFIAVVTTQRLAILEKSTTKVGWTVHRQIKLQDLMQVQINSSNPKIVSISFQQAKTREDKSHTTQDRSGISSAFGFFGKPRETSTRQSNLSMDLLCLKEAEALLLSIVLPSASSIDRREVRMQENSIRKRDTVLSLI